MKKILLISVVLFVFLAMVSCATTPTGERILRSRGTVLSYEPGKMISLEPGMTEVEYTGSGDYIAAPGDAPQALFAYAITPATELKGEVKKGIRVVIRYTQVGSGPNAAKTAVSIDPVWGK